MRMLLLVAILAVSGATAFATERAVDADRQAASAALKDGRYDEAEASYIRVRDYYLKEAAKPFDQTPASTERARLGKKALSQDEINTLRLVHIRLRQSQLDVASAVSLVLANLAELRGDLVAAKSHLLDAAAYDPANVLAREALDAPRYR